MIFYVKCLFTISVFAISPTFSIAADYNVVYVSVLFQHDGRTPISLYKKDPNPERKFHPPGLEMLPKGREERANQLGLILRNRYKNFLGRNENFPYRVKARSTDSGRTRKSMELVLNALYQPGNYEPILFSSAAKGADMLLVPTDSIEYCEELDKVQKSNEVMKKINKFRPLMNTLTHWTGQEIKSTEDISTLYHMLTAEYAMKFELPSWAWHQSVWEQIKEATVLNYEIHNYNYKLRRYSGGVLLKHIIKTMNDKVGNKIKRERMQLFSGEGTTVVALLSALGVYKPFIPEYSSAVILELVRGRPKKYYIRILYYERIPSEPITLPLSECSMDPCPLDEFMQLMKSVIPSESYLETKTGKFVNIEK